MSQEILAKIAALKEQLMLESQIREWPFNDYFISYGPQGEFKNMSRGDTVFDFKKGTVKFGTNPPVDDTLALTIDNIPGKPPYLQSGQIWGDTHYRIGIKRNDEILGFIRGSGLDYTRLPPGVKFDALIIRELAMPAVISLTVGTAKESLVSENVPLFQNRSASLTTSLTTFSTSNTGDDIPEFVPVAGGSNGPAGSGRQSLHISGVKTKIFIVSNTGLTNGALVRLRGNSVETGGVFATDPATPSGGFYVEANTTYTIATTIPYHRMIFQGIQEVGGGATTLAVQYWGVNIP